MRRQCINLNQSWVDQVQKHDETSIKTPSSESSRGSYKSVIIGGYPSPNFLETPLNVGVSSGYATDRVSSLTAPRILYQLGAKARPECTAKLVRGPLSQVTLPCGPQSTTLSDAPQIRCAGRGARWSYTIPKTTWVLRSNVLRECQNSMTAEKAGVHALCTTSELSTRRSLEAGHLQDRILFTQDSGQSSRVYRTHFALYLILMWDGLLSHGIRYFLD